MTAGERLPEHHPDRPDVRRLRGQLAGQPLRRDVGKGPGHVTLRGEGLGLAHLREAEVEHADGNIFSLRKENVGRLDVAVDDAPLVRVSERFEHLGSCFDCCAIVELAPAQGLTERSARNVFIGDVDVTRIPAEPVRALTRRVPQAGGGLRLPFGPRGGLPLARHDLERDVEAVALVSSEPDGPGATAAQGAQRSVPSKHEVALDEGWRCIRHRLSWVGEGGCKSFTGLSTG
jgi:hypothetical protein